MLRLLKQRGFAFSQHLDVGLKLYYPEGHSKLFQINNTQTVSDVQKLIFEEEQGRFLQMKLLMGNKDYINDEIGFLDFIVHNPVQLFIDGKSYAYEVDSNGPANYIFDRTGFEREFDRLEIPFQDSYVVGKFYTQLLENLARQDKGVYTQQRLQTTIDETLQKFAQKNQRATEYWTLYQQVYEQVQNDLAEKEEQIQTVHVESKDEGHKLLKKWIAISIAQYLFLLVLTYGIYSWNVSEPISYLLAQALETIGIFYFLRRGFAFRQGTLFQHRFQLMFNKSINTKFNSTNFLREAAFAKARAHMAQNKLLYGTTSV